MLTLDHLRRTRIAKGWRRQFLAAVTGLADDRLHELELRTAEPWFDEAVLLSRALMVSGVLPLMSSDDLTTYAEAGPLPTDVEVWRSGVRPPLSLAMRIARRFGLADPCDLVVTPLQRQIWDVVAASERTPEAPGWCPWCAADIVGGDDHLPTCLPHNLYSPRLELHIDVPAPAIVPRPATKVPRGRGIPAYGLKAQREARGMRQAEVAALIGVHANHYARVERAELPLTVDLADALASHFNVDRAVLYARPGEEEA